MAKPTFRAELALAIREAQRGNVRPFIEIQWPDILLDDFQWDFVESAFDQSIKETFCKGCTAPGKGYSMAVTVNAYFDVWDDARIIITSKNFEHAKSELFREVKMVRRMMRDPCRLKRGGWQTEALIDHEGHLIKVYNPNEKEGGGEGFSGQHGKHILFAFDESSAVPDVFYEQSTKQAHKILAISNPRTLSGWFRRSFEEAEDIDETQTIVTRFGRRRLITIGGEDCLNVREKLLKDPVGPVGGIEIDGKKYKHGDVIADEDFRKVQVKIPSQIDYGRFMATMAASSEWERRVLGLGLFPIGDDAVNVIMPGWLHTHHEAWSKRNNDIKIEACALDPAFSKKGDRSALAIGGSMGCKALHTPHKPLTTPDEILSWVLGTLKRYGVDLTMGAVPIEVDANGASGVISELKKKGCWIIEYWAASPPIHEPRRYMRRRAEVYGELGRRLDTLGDWAEQPWPLPHDNELDEELTAPKKIFPPSGEGVRFDITPKTNHSGKSGETLRKILGRSPDKADAVTMLYDAVLNLGGIEAATVDRPLLLITEEEEAERNKFQAKFDELASLIYGDVDDAVDLFVC